MSSSSSNIRGNKMAKNKLRNRRKKRMKNFMKKKEAEVRPVADNFVQFVNKEQTCQRCGKCCHAYIVLLTQDDLDREPKIFAVSHPIKSSEQEIINPDGKYCRITNTTEDNKRCPLYKDGIGCSIYDTRPDLCREYISSFCNCLYGRLGCVGFSVKAWYDNNMDAYCQTQLHRITRLDPLKDSKAVYLYFLIIPYLISEEKVRQYRYSKRVGTLIQKHYTIEDFIDLDQIIPDCIREDLQLNDEYQTIKDIFTPHTCLIPSDLGYTNG